MNINKKFIIGSIIIIFLIVTSIFLLSNGDSVKFINYMNIFYVVFVLFLVLFFIYSRTITRKYNIIITNYNNGSTNLKTLEELKKLQKLYLPSRIKKETKTSIELIEKSEVVEQGIQKLSKSN